LLPWKGRDVWKKPRPKPATDVIRHLETPEESFFSFPFFFESFSFLSFFLDSPFLASGVVVWSALGALSVSPVICPAGGAKVSAGSGAAAPFVVARIERVLGWLLTSEGFAVAFTSSFSFPFLLSKTPSSEISRPLRPKINPTLPMILGRSGAGFSLLDSG